MTRALLVLLALGWLVFALSGYVVGYVVDYVNGSSATYYFLMLDNGSLIPLVEPPPHYLVGTGERVEAELVYTEVGVGARVLAPREPTQAIPRQPVSGSLLVTLVAAKFADVSFEPYNMSYVHDLAFGPFPSMRHFWESASGGAVVIRPYYIHWGWVTLPRTKADYCNTGNAFSQIAVDVINVLYSKGVMLPSYSYLVIILNDRPSCFGAAAGIGTLRFWRFNTPYGTIHLAVSLILHYTNFTRNNPNVLVIAHEFGHNLGLDHPGTQGDDVRFEYDNYWDVMGNLRLRRYLNSWLGVAYYDLPNGLSLPHLYFLGWGSFVGSGVGVWFLGPRSGVYIPASDGVYTVEYKCGGVYEQFLDWCGVVVHRVSSSEGGRWVFFHTVLNVTGVIVSPFNFLDVGQSAWVAGQRVSVVWRNSTHARVVVGLPTLADVIGANATFVVGSGAAAIDSVAAVYARLAFSPTATFTLPVFHFGVSNSRMHFNPLFAYLDDEQWLTQVRYYSMGSGWLYYPVRYPGVVVSVGGPFANSLTRALNPPDRPGAGGLPFYFDTGAGGIRDARTGQVWRSNVAVVAVVPNGSRVYVLVWGLGGEDTRRVARWLAECVPPRAYAVVINTTDFRVLASWPSGFVGASVCPGAVYTAAAVVGANAASIDAVGAAMAAGGLGLLDSEVVFGELPPYVFSVGGPLANSFTRLYNPPDGLGFGGLPFYYSTSRGGIVDGRTGALLCTSNCFVVAKLIDRGKAVVLAWGTGGDDTRAAAAYLHHHGRTLLDSRNNTAKVVRWSYLSQYGYRYGVDFTTLATWP
jgi:M6 family metalloprotease-like protein